MTAVARLTIGGAGPPGEPDGNELEEVSVPSLGQLREAAAGASAPLLWILDAGATPGPDTLEALLGAGTLPAASLPVDAAGLPIERLIGRYEDGDIERLLAAARRHQAPLRHTHLVSLLVDRAAVVELAPPDPVRYRGYAASEWTARLLARHPGVLVPASRVRAPEPPKPVLRAALRMVRTSTWRRGEALRELRRVLPG
jgi:hypothetical protein